MIVLPSSRTDILVGLGFGVLNAVGALTLVYASPMLQDVLEPFDPTYHFLTSIWFAAVIVYCTFRAWVDVGRPLQTLPSNGRLLECSVIWGATSGAVFALAWLSVAVLTGIVMGVTEGDSQRLIGSILGGLFYAIGGASLGGMIGGIFGIVTGAIDVGVLLLVRRLPGFPQLDRTRSAS